MIEIEIKTLELQQNISRAAQGLEQRGSLMRLIAGRLHQAVDENFNSQGRPAWAGLKLGSQLSRAGALTKRGQVSQARFDKYVRNHKILQKTGRLRNSITEASDNDSARVGTNVAYAAIQNFGGQTAAHMIYPRHKKALAWATGAYPVKSVKHPGSRIPARAFMQLTPQDEHELVETVSDYLASVCGLPKGS